MQQSEDKTHQVRTPEEEYHTLMQFGDLVYDQTFTGRFGDYRELIFIYHGVRNYVRLRNNQLFQLNGMLVK